ncbi:MAG: hypothetical protein HY000_37920 [Planctomycetes bacterium]|nr:hypothetical protein [Planctomycetota bacterium]
MTAKEANIERIVREVIAKLSAAEMAPHEANGETELCAGLPTPHQREQRTSEELVLSARVVTLGELDRLDGVKRLVVPPRAVITPAARDLLRQRGVDVAYALPRSGTKRRLAVGSSKDGRDPAALIQRLKAEGIEVERVANTGLGEMVAEVADLVARSAHLGLVWTAHTTAALCLANRHHGVRAVCGADATILQQAIQAVGANVLIIRPGSLSDFQLRRLMSEFCNGTPTCPREYEKWLR